MNLPKAFEEKMRQLLHEEYEDYIACYEEPRHFGLRVNTNKISVEDFLEIAPWPLRPIPWVHNGFYYDGESIHPAKHPYYFAGLYYLQEPSAMTPADRLPVEPGEKVLDICAAPGGKATELGAKLEGRGVLIANDISNSRAKGLLKNLELFGIGNMLVLSEEPGKLTTYFPEYFDKILIDAPCSGEGMFRKDKKMVKAWEEHGPEFFSKLQRSIITQAASMLKPGGSLLYSTCTFDGLENEQTIEYLLSEYPEFEICGIEPYEGFAPGMPGLTDSQNAEFQKTVRIFPHKMEGEGHYLALLRKGKPEEQDEKTKKDKNLSKTAAKAGKLPEELAGFWADVNWELDASRLDIHGERIYYMPKELPDMRGIRFLRSGLLLGELKKNRFEPSQALAMCLKKEEYTKVLDFSLEDERVMKYLKGETLDVEDKASPKEKGWYLICVDGFPLGFGKLAGQTLKNKYLPGWRCQS
ncbi:MAG: RsmF rRNA methyltransferase first C-terminal domain-containing protein [Muricomes sp.]